MFPSEYLLSNRSRTVSEFLLQGKPGLEADDRPVDEANAARSAGTGARPDSEACSAPANTYGPGSLSATFRRLMIDSDRFSIDRQIYTRYGWFQFY